MRTALVLATVVACVGCGPQNGTVGPTSANFGDPQVLGPAVVMTDHQWLIVAEAALTRGLFHPQVTAYAMRLVVEMQPARDRLLVIGTQQGIAVDEDTVEARDNLGDDDITPIQPPVTGVEVDRIYMPDSVHDIQKAIAIWDNTLLPNVTNAVLHAELLNTRLILVNELAAGMQVLQETGLAPE